MHELMLGWLCKFELADHCVLLGLSALEQTFKCPGLPGAAMPQHVLSCSQ